MRRKQCVPVVAAAPRGPGAGDYPTPAEDGTARLLLTHRSPAAPGAGAAEPDRTARDQVERPVPGDGHAGRRQNLHDYLHDYPHLPPVPARPGRPAGDLRATCGRTRKKPLSLSQ